MTVPLVTLAVILGLLLAEARVSARNDRALRDRGAVAPAGDVYWMMAVAYPAVFLAMGIEAAWRASTVPDAAGATGEPAFYASGLLLFAASKGLKYWAIGALGDRWTFRVLILRGVPLIRTGPYRYVAHPNYIAVVGELAGTAMMMEAWVAGPVALVAFGALLRRRVAFETEALRQAYSRIKS